MADEIVESIPAKPSLRNVQTPDYGVPKNMQYKVLQDISRAHVDSFNFIFKEGLRSVVENIQPLELSLPNGDRLKIELKNCIIQKPYVNSNIPVRTSKEYPKECRERGKTYRGDCIVGVRWSLNDSIRPVIEKKIGEVPIMVKSIACNLSGLKPKELISKGEEEHEFGGYFIINGLEKIVRLLIMQRRNYPIAMQRSNWKKKGDLFTEFGVSIRCVRADQSGSNLVLHYLSDGTVKLMLTYKKAVYFLPVMLVLKALVDAPDSYIYKQLIKSKEKDTFYKGCISNMLRQMSCSEGIIFQDQALNYLGEKFSVRFNPPSWYTNIDVAKVLINQCICVHLDNYQDKFNLLVFMVQKLFAVVKNESALESSDNIMNHEVLLPGHFYMIVLKEKLYSWLYSVKLYLERKMKSSKTSDVNEALIKDCLNKSMNITKSFENVFSTGNFLPTYERSLMQFTGLVTVADKLNFWRYLSHFRAVHRGAFFAQMRTTTVRKLLPEAWGFLCPVHTPDGSPCGLLNHMTASAQIVNEQPDVRNILNVFCKYGMIPYDDPVPGGYTVLMDGKIVGRLHEVLAFNFVMKIRHLKSLGKENVPKTMEICFIKKLSSHSSQYPGLFVFTNPARFIRPVKNLLTGVNELIGTMEQVYLHIACKESDVVPGATFHQELYSTAILSVLGNQIPYSDYNQSPRNMYECQMGKQTMGTPCHNYKYRSDNKLYRILTPQAPIVRPKMHDYYHMDDYALGTNAIVAVISYTGYDMEDAFILNKSSVERGFKHGMIYKTQVINLREISGDRGLQKTYEFGRDLSNDKLDKFIDKDGLPYIGTRLNCGDPICSYKNIATNEFEILKYKSTDEAYVDDVKLLGNNSGTDNQKIAIKFRVPRNPIIGDKFASRHGQKGICSLMLPAEDMPFTESGMTPDILFNPHGFPSRMTIGMMIESMAGKSSAIQGVLHDATPFEFSENDTAISYFGELLKKAGFDYYGTETMYSGVSGIELEANIFMGVVYYQRLRHMVSDKYQVRSTGPVEPYTRQPVKGRKNNGGIRFGEMERDAIIAHGANAIMYDRLFKCSDGCQQYVCKKCESILSPMFEGCEVMEFNDDITEWICKVCGTSDDVVTIDLPYVFRYFTSELAAMNVRVRLKIGDCFDWNS